MNDSKLVQKFARVAVFKAGGKRAPHKPLLLLLALARIQSGGSRLIPYADVKEVLEPLLARLWSSRNAHAMYPFWHLRSDGIWQVEPEDHILAAIAHLKKTTVPDAVLLAEHAAGGFPTELDSILRSRPDLVNTIAERILLDHFPPSLHEDILDAVGMPWVIDADAKPRKRDPRFREAVLRAYARRCAICGYDGRIGTSDLGLEAAHIQWHAAGGPDIESNGLALCTFHHKVFDLGAITVSTAFQVVISPDVNGGDAVDQWVSRFEGNSILLPRNEDLQPGHRFLEWHLRQVFRDSRPLAG